MSFLRARSPVTPKTTSAHGSGTRGRRRARGSRRGLRGPVGCFIGASHRLAGDRLQQLLQSGATVGQMQPDDGSLPALQCLQVAECLRELQTAERKWLSRYVEVGGVRPGDLQERAALRSALVELTGRVQ